MNDQRQTNPMRFCRRTPLLRATAALVLAVLVLGACGGSDDDGPVTVSSLESDRSSGSNTESTEITDGANGTDGADEANGETGADDGPGTTLLGPELSDYTPTFRPDGLELAFVDGALGPARLGATIGEITAALGPSYEVTPEESIRVDFPAGYSVSREGEVLFFAIEEDGIINVFMTQHPRVGLDSGLRPSFGLDEAIALHGEPSLTLGPESREFASFEDGTGGDGDVSVLVAIGQFGGPVGIYDGVEADEPATSYELENANIKEIWFWDK